MLRVLTILLGASAVILAGCKGSRKSNTSQPARPAFNAYTGYNGLNAVGGWNQNAGYGAGFDSGDDGGLENEIFGVSAVNGSYLPQRQSELFVSPGDVLSLGSGAARWGRGYSWESSLNDRCVFGSAFECGGGSNFRWDHGPRFVVPRALHGVVRLTIRVGPRAETILLRPRPLVY